MGDSARQGWVTERSDGRPRGRILDGIREQETSHREQETSSQLVRVHALRQLGVDAARTAQGNGTDDEVPGTLQADTASVVDSHTAHIARLTESVAQ